MYICKLFFYKKLTSLTKNNLKTFFVVKCILVITMITNWNRNLSIFLCIEANQHRNAPSIILNSKTIIGNWFSNENIWIILKCWTLGIYYIVKWVSLTFSFTWKFPTRLIPKAENNPITKAAVLTLVIILTGQSFW